MKIKQTILELVCYLFVFLFIYAAANKLMDVQKFSVQLGQSPMLTRWSLILAWAVPLTEIVIALSLLLRRYQKIALYASLNLMTMFTAYIIIITNFSPHIPCSCGGVLEKLGWQEHLYFNISFVILAIIGLWLIDTITGTEASSLSDKTYPNKNISVIPNA